MDNHLFDWVTIQTMTEAGANSSLFILIGLFYPRKKPAGD
jgi:hypothetical protein